MVSVRKSLLQLLFAGSFMKRWNDKHRSMDLVEIDKQAHKMMVAWMLYELNSRHLSEPDRLALGLEIVEGGLFEYLYRLVITDIKPPVFYQIKANPDHYGRLTAWVFDQLEPRVRDLGDDFGQRLREYLAVPEGTTPARRILDAAHLYASGWEYSLIKRDNPWDDELLEIESSFRDGLARFSDLAGVADLAAGLFEGKKRPLATSAGCSASCGSRPAGPRLRAFPRPRSLATCSWSRPTPISSAWPWTPARPGGSTTFSPAWCTTCPSF